MKRVILCILACILLLTLTCCAAAEECYHEHQIVKGLLIEWEDFETGHRLVETNYNICDPCGKKFMHQTCGELEEHVYHLAESIHFVRDTARFQMHNEHLWVFICPTCWHIQTLVELCAGEDDCLRFNAQEGENPQVQYGESLNDWHEENTKQDYILRWLLLHEVE